MKNLIFFFFTASFFVSCDNSDLLIKKAQEDEAKLSIGITRLDFEKIYNFVKSRGYIDTDTDCANCEQERLFTVYPGIGSYKHILQISIPENPTKQDTGPVFVCTVLNYRNNLWWQVYEDRIVYSKSTPNHLVMKAFMEIKNFINSKTN